MPKGSKLKSDQTGQNPVSAAVVKSGRLDTTEGSVARKDKNKDRSDYLKVLETDAKNFVEGFQKAKAISDEAIVLHRKFKDLVKGMRPVFERVRFGFAHLRKGETVMGERTGPAWAKRYIGLTYDHLCRCLHPPKGTLLLPDGTEVLVPSTAKSDRSRKNQEQERPKLTQKLTTIPTSDTADWTDNAYVKTCVDFLESTLRPLESDPLRFHRIAVAIAQEILGEPGTPEDSILDSKLAAVYE